MKLKLSESWEGAPDDADKVINNLLKPYYEDECSFSRGESDDTEIMLLGTFENKKRHVDECPHVYNGRMSQLWDLFKKDLTSCFENCDCDECVCTVKHDAMYGGPILIIDEGDCVSTYRVAIAEWLDEKKA